MDVKDFFILDTTVLSDIIPNIMRPGGEHGPIGDARTAFSSILLRREPTQTAMAVQAAVSEFTVNSAATSPAELRSNPNAYETFANFLLLLNKGEVRSATPTPTENGGQDWTVNSWVKDAIFLGFKLGQVIVVSSEGETLQFSDKDTLPPNALTDSPSRTIRIVPGGSSIRSGSFIGDKVIMMPPSYVNIGTYVGESTMLDSFSLVGSCAQVGKGAHIAAGAKIGGVLEPSNARPCIVEDDVKMLADSGIYEGVILKKGAVLAPNVILTSGIEVWERLPQEDSAEPRQYRQLPNSKENPVVIPERALVIPRTHITFRPDGSIEPFAKHVALISGYYPQGGNKDLAIEAALRV